MASQQTKIEEQTKDDYPSMRSVDVGKPPKERKRQLVNKEASATASPKLPRWFDRRRRGIRSNAGFTC